MTEGATVDERVRAACVAARWSDAATIAIEGYGPEVLSYLRALARSETDAGDLFATFCEALWSSLPRFRWESSLRTWAYALARHGWMHLQRDRARHGPRRVGLSDVPSHQLAEKIRSSTPIHLRADMKDRLAEVRDGLDPEEQTLLILRVDREMSWRDIAQIMRGDDDDGSPEAVERRAQTLRKRFMRMKESLRGKLRGD